MARMRRLIPALASALALAACATPTPYQPLTPNNRASGGYTDQQIEANRYRVTFSGNSMTSRETVETYLLYRAAELTIARGYDWFQMAQRNTDRHTNTYVDQPFGPGPWGYWGPSWRYHGGFGWRGWDPFWGDPFWGNDIDVTTVDRYEASAEILMGHGPKPADNPRAFDARQVVSNLQSRIMMPK
ncbi:MAG: hypothetical protein JOY99_17185 [Sphingomonadaceae bacterium]|nr:hypothetical protein [Sphingomonadaceae bacterium]